MTHFKNILFILAMLNFYTAEASVDTGNRPIKENLYPSEEALRKSLGYSSPMYFPKEKKGG